MSDTYGGFEVDGAVKSVSGAPPHVGETSQLKQGNYSFLRRKTCNFWCLLLLMLVVLKSQTASRQCRPPSLFVMITVRKQAL